VINIEEKDSFFCGECAGGWGVRGSLRAGPGRRCPRAGGVPALAVYRADGVPVGSAPGVAMSRLAVCGSLRAGGVQAGGAPGWRCPSWRWRCPSWRCPGWRCPGVAASGLAKPTLAEPRAHGVRLSPVWSGLAVSEAGGAPGWWCPSWRCSRAGGAPGVVTSRLAVSGSLRSGLG